MVLDVIWRGLAWFLFLFSLLMIPTRNWLCCMFVVAFACISVVDFYFIWLFVRTTVLLAQCFLDF